MMRQARPFRVMTVSSVRLRMGWLLLSAAFLLGAVGGHLLAGRGLVDPEALLEQLREQGQPQSWQEMALSLRPLAQRLLMALVLSFSVLGVAALPLLLMVQGFAAGCAVSVLVRRWGVDGLTAGAVWIGLERFCALWALMLACVPGWELSRRSAAGERMNRATWTGCVRCWVYACAVGLGGSVICKWLICRYLPRLLWGA